MNFLYKYRLEIYYIDKNPRKHIIYLCVKLTSWINKWYSVKCGGKIIESIEFNVNYIDERFYGV